MTVPDGPVAAGVTGATGAAGVDVLEVEPPDVAGVGATGAGAAGVAAVTFPWNDVSHTSFGMVREMAWSIDDHDTSLARSAWVSDDRLSI